MLCSPFRKNKLYTYMYISRGHTQQKPIFQNRYAGEKLSGRTGCPEGLCDVLSADSFSRLFTLRAWVELASDSEHVVLM